MSEPLNPYASPQALEKPVVESSATPFQQTAAPYQSSRVKANIALAATVFLLLMEGLLIGSFLMQISLLTEAQATGGVDPAAAQANDARHLGLSGGVLIALLVSFIALLVWIYAAQRNLPALQPSKTLEFTPGWAVGWFFVPIMNLFKPFQAMRQLWNESDPSQLVLPGDPRSIVPAATLVGWWWGLRIVSLIASRAFGNFDQTTIEGLIAESWMAIVLTAALDVPLHVCQLFLIRGVQANQEARITKIENRASPPTSSPVALAVEADNPWAKFQ